MTEPTTDLAELQATNTVPAGTPFENAQAFELTQRMAKALSQSRLVPKAFQGELADCMIAIEIAHRLNVSPMSVLQNLHIIEGKPSFSAKFMISAFNASPDYGPMRYEWKGEEGSDEYGCRAVAFEKATEEFLMGPWIDIAMAKAEGWFQKKGSKWQTIPQKMLMYRAAAWFIDVHAPELMLAAPSMDGNIIDVEPIVISDPEKALSQTMAEAAKRQRKGEPLGEVVLDGEQRQTQDHYQAMRRVSISEYRRLAFVGRPPCANTIKRWIDRGIISGEKLGGMYFVHVGEPEQPENPLLKRMVQG